MTIKSLRQYFAPDVAAASTAITSIQNDLKVYNTPNDLPLTDIKSGQQAYVIGNKGLYVWTGTAWYVISTVTSDLTLTQTASSSYTLSVNGTPTYVNLAATSSNPVTWTYAANAALGNTTVAHTGGDFSITPSTNASDNGVFLIKFVGNDGTGVVGSTSEFILNILPPPPGTLYGWFGGGYAPGPSTRVDRIDYAADTGTASIRGPLTLGRYSLAATGNEDYSWYAGGYNGYPLSTVDRIDYAADTGTASSRGKLSIERQALAASGNTNYGWVAGGGNPGGSGVYRITYTNDTLTTTQRGSLTGTRYQFSATGNMNYGWFGGGIVAFPNFKSTIDRIDYSNDGVTASARGYFSVGRGRMSGTSNANYGWFVGGNWPGISLVDRVDYAADTSIASVRGPLSLAKNYISATGTSSYGWVGGGSSGPLSTVDRIDYADDTATAVIRGPLSSARYGLAATGGYPG